MIKIIKKIIKRILPSTYKKVDDVRLELLAEIKSIHAEISSVRAEIGSVRAEIGSVRAEIGSVRAEIDSKDKVLEESQYRLKNVEKILSVSSYESLKKENETRVDFEKRMLTYLPKSICSCMHEKNMHMEDVVRDLVWKHSEIPFSDLDYTWRYLIENSNSSTWELFEQYTSFLFYHGDLLDNLESAYLSKISEFEKWTSISQLSYISFLYYKHKETDAVQMLKQYMDIRGEENLDYFIPVAYLAGKHFGVQNELVQLSSKRFETMKKNEGLFEKLVNSSSFALVGNGPQEKGKGSGERIDSHNLVLRFNSYNLAKEYQADYGKKVDIWANCGNVIEDKREKGHFKYFMYLPGIYDEPMADRFLDGFDNAFTVDMLALRKRIYEKTGLYCTSNGFNLIFAVNEVNKKFSADDCFGFSFKDDVIGERWLHYDNCEVKGIHPLDAEKREIIKIFTENVGVNA